MPPKLSGWIVNPARLNDPYIYHVDIEQPGAIRISTTPRITVENGIRVYLLDYATDARATSVALDLWDLGITYQNSLPHDIKVRILLDNRPHHEDKPRVQDGM